jgi:hypothetical protein
MMGTALDRLFEGFLLAKEAAGVRDTTLDIYRRAFNTLTQDLPPSSWRTLPRLSPPISSAG